MTQSGGVFIYSHSTKYNDLRIKKNNSVKIRFICVIRVLVFGI